MAQDVHRAIGAIRRFESAKPIAGLEGIVGDAGPAEDLARGALVAAREREVLLEGAARSGRSPGSSAEP